ncbi:MAG TPA: hypothetical protein VMT64_06900 [Candidatus Binataceae bacterium]|nr:hypothetical protein [Candidatus Binataceae bacterium]
MISDIAVLNKQGEPVLLVEVKNNPGTSKEWASKLRRNIMAHGLLPHVPYFMVATPDHFYLWKNAGNHAEELEPNYDLDPHALSDRRFVPDEKVGPFEFETKVASWLTDMLRPESGRPNGAVGDLLLRSGLLDAIHGGSLAFENGR